MAFWRTGSFDDLEVGGRVLLKGQAYEIVGLVPDTQEVTVMTPAGKRTGRAHTWRYKPRDAPNTVDFSELGKALQAGDPTESGDAAYRYESAEELITVQEYLRAVGMPDEELEGSARVFGTSLMAAYRKLYGKDAKPAKKLEYVHYLDRNGMEAQRSNVDAPRHLRVPANGWYESNAFTEADLPLLDAVRQKRHPSLPSLEEATQTAIKNCSIGAIPLDREPRGMREQVQLIWLVEQAVKKCLQSGVVCGHTECARRRSKNSNRIRRQDLEDWS